MPSPEASKSLTGSWQKIFDSETDGGRVRGYLVAVDPLSLTPVQVFVKPCHGVASGAPTGDGLLVESGQREAFFANRAAGGGAITEVWAKLDDLGSANVTHGAVHH